MCIRDSNNINDTKDGWTLLQVEKTGLAAGDDDANGVIKGYLVFTYAYNSMLANTDSINTKYADLVGETIQKKTTPLFEKIRMINVVEGQLDLVSYQMPIKVFAIQAAHTGTGGDEDSNTPVSYTHLDVYKRQALYYTLYHCQLIFGNIIPNDIYVTWDMQKVKEISNTIYDRWFTRNTLIPVGKWTTDFMERVFDDDRKNEALLSFYNDYINKVLFSGSYFKVIDISAEDRFDEE